MKKSNKSIYNLLCCDDNINAISTLEDNFKNSYELEFDFNNRNVKDDGFTAIPIGNFRPLLK